jgi:hypothetical protein
VGAGLALCAALMSLPMSELGVLALLRDVLGLLRDVRAQLVCDAQGCLQIA